MSVLSGDTVGRRCPPIVMLGGARGLEFGHPGSYLVPCMSLPCHPLLEKITLALWDLMFCVGTLQEVAEGQGLACSTGP